MITYQPKTFENPNIFGIKSVITEHPKNINYPRLLKKGEKVGSNSSLYSNTKKHENFLNEENMKIAKPKIFLKAMQALIMLKF